ncbi:MAG: hypothetical protein QXO75_10480 [Nitrososphaerota archaeon]
MGESFSCLWLYGMRRWLGAKENKDQVALTNRQASFLPNLACCRVEEFTTASNLYVLNGKMQKGIYILDRFISPLQASVERETWEPKAKYYYEATMLA